MQVQSSQPLCRLSADIPLLEGTPVDESPQHRAVFQERYVAQSHNTHISTASPGVGQRSSLSPSDSPHAQRGVATGTYYTGNVHAQNIGLAGFGVERSEKQIRCELGRLYKLLQRSEKYQTYREKQPALTPAEVVARDAAERKQQENRKVQGLQQEKDKTVWPDFLEHAFWTGRSSLSSHRMSPCACLITCAFHFCSTTDPSICNSKIPAQNLTNIPQHSFDGRQWVERNICSKVHSEGGMSSSRILFTETPVSDAIANRFPAIFRSSRTSS